MSAYKCQVCEFVYDDDKEDTLWSDRPDDWTCPVCGSPKKLFQAVVAPIEPPTALDASPETESLEDLLRPTDEIETYMSDIHQMADTGSSIIEPMRTRKPTFTWDDILIKGAQLATIPLNKDVRINTTSPIGPKSDQPLVLETPIFITHMSFGALSREAKIALARGSAAVQTAMCSGEGGILPESIESSYRYIFEYVPNLYSFNADNIHQVDAIEIKFGQSAKPGMGGHLPASKVTPEIAEIRGRQVGEDIVSPAHFDDITNPDELKTKVAWLRDMSKGKPIGIKFAAGQVEADLEVALYAEPDFITIDGRAGATGASPKFVKASTSVPTIFAAYRARKYLDAQGAADVSLVLTGGLRVSSDFAKALALGANAVAIGSAALMAIGCQQYRICNTGKCPMGIATQDPELRQRFNIDKSARRLENYLRVSTEELKDFARLTGKKDIHLLSTNDLCTTNSEVSNYTAIEHV